MVTSAAAVVAPAIAGNGEPSVAWKAARVANTAASARSTPCNHRITIAHSSRNVIGHLGRATPSRGAPRDDAA